MSWKSIIRVVFFAAAVAAPVLITWQLQTSSPRTKQRLGLSIDQRELSLGDVWAQSDFSHSVTLRNTSRQSVTVLDMFTTCECTSVTPKQFVIGPGKTTRLNLKLNLLRGAPVSEPTLTRPFAVSIRPITNSANSEGMKWQLRATLQDPISYVPPYLYIGDCFGGAAFDEQVLAITMHPKVKQLSVSVDDARLRLTLSPVDSDPKKLNLRVEPLGPFEIGSIEVPITLSATTETGDALEPIRTTAVGTLRSPMMVLPDRVALGAIPCGQTRSTVVKISSLAGGVVTLVSVRCGDGTFSAETIAADANGHAQLRVTASPQAAGNYEAIVTVVAAESSLGYEGTIHIPVTWYCSTKSD